MESQSEDQDDSWMDKGDYWVSKHQQGTTEWLRQRKQLLTGSNFGTAAGHNVYEDKQSYAARWSRGQEQSFSKQARKHLNRGVRLEPVVRTFYEVKRGVRVEQVGLIVPKWDTRIGVSVDGLVGDDGCIEIKCPEVMYPNLRRKDLAQRLRIPAPHYDQMQGGMAVTGRQWCDYIVYCEDTGQVHIERVYFDSEYWSKTLYPALVRFLEDIRNTPSQAKHE